MEFVGRGAARDAGQNQAADHSAHTTQPKGASGAAAGPAQVAQNGAEAQVMAAAAALAAGAPAQAPLPGAGHVTRVVPNADGTVTLPADANLQTIHAQGRDLVVDLPDGSKIIIVDGAVSVPKIVVGEVEVPATNLAALLIGNEPHPAAGGTSSSGGDFSVPPGNIGPGFHIGDLLPPTELAFGVVELPQLFPGRINHVPDVIVNPDGSPSAINAEQTVYEAGLPARPVNEPAGSDFASNSETATGNIVYDAGDPPLTVTINGVAVTAVGQIIHGAYGDLTITSIAVGTIGYSYTLADNTSGDNTHDDFAVLVTDVDGDTANATLVIHIIDDVPTAHADVDSVTAVSQPVADGNVFTGVGGSDANATDGVADTTGADNATVTGVVAGTASSASGHLGAPLAGAHGSLVLDADGSYVYTVNSADPAVVALGAGATTTDVFTYTITDGDGDTSTTTLTITITGANDAPVALDATTRVSEEGLANANPDNTGNTDTTNSATSSGTVSFTDPDVGDTHTFALTAPAGAFTSGGQAIAWALSNNGHTLTGTINGGATTIVTITINDAGAYNVTLSGPVDHPDTTSEDNVSIPVGVTVTDNHGASDSSTLTVTVEDDSPIAVNDADSITEGSQTPATGNVITGVDGGLGFSDANGADGNVDHPGADGLGGITWTGAVGNTISGGSHHGVLTIDANGNYSYALSNNDPAVQALGEGQTLTDTFTYTITDKDGDPSTATLTITINGVNAPPEVEPATARVSEEGLPNANADSVGNTDTTNSPTASGTVSFTDPDVGDTHTFALTVPAGTFTSGGSTIVWTLSNSGHTLDGTINGGATNVVHITIDDAGAYNVTLNEPMDHPVAGQEDNLGFAVGVTVSDNHGGTGSSTLTVTVEDDSPVVVLADQSTPTLTVDETDLTTNATANFANLFENHFGADGPAASGSTAFSLGVGGIGNGQDSGLLDVATGNHIFLFLESGQVVGREGANAGDAAGGPIDFTVSVDGSGNVTLDQVRALTHPDASDPNDPVSMASGLVTLSETIKDYDGDTAANSVSISDHLTFLDDGPHAVDDVDSVVETGPTTATGNVVTGVDGGLGSDANGTDGNADSLGADGFGSIAWTGAVGNTVSGAGHHGTLTIDANGNYSYALNPNDAAVQALGSGDHIDDTFTYTVTDGDGDTSTATLTITINGSNQPPELSPETTRVSEEGLPNANADSVGNTDTTNSATSSGTVTFTDPDVGDTHTFALTAPAGTFTSGGSTITWTLSNGGHTLDGTINGGATNIVHITITDAGAYNVTLNGPVDHPDTTSEDNISFAVGVTVTDNHGASDSSTLTVTVEDDSPVVTVNAEVPSLTVDETNLAGDSSTSFAGAFGGGYGADGPAASGAKVFALGISATGADSGLVDTASGNHIFLFLESGQVVGREGTTALTAVGGPIDFVVSVNTTTGVVTLDQQRAIVHADPNNPNDSTTLSAASLVTLTETLTDYDGDHASNHINIGASLNFLDDGPSISLTQNSASITDDETNLSVNNSASFAGLFTSSFGADGAGAVTYALGISASGADSGLVDTASGNHIFLFLESGQVVGREGTTALTAVGGPIDFVVSINSSTGVVTLDQQRAIVHADPNNPNDSATLSAANLITVIGTVTDHDGDHASVSANIGTSFTFLDDGPSISLTQNSASITDDETNLSVNNSASFAGLFTSSFGADGAGTVTYALGISASGVDSGLVDTASGNHIFLFLESGQVVGREGANAGAAAAGPIDFVVSINSSTGVVTLDQQRAIVHADPNNPNDSATLSAANLITVIGTVTDHDGDHASVTANIGTSLNFLDDGPSISLTASSASITDDETNLATNNSASFAALFTSSFGADGAGAVSYALGVSASGVDSGLVDTASGNHIFLFLESGQVVGREGANAGAAAGGPIDFVVSINSSTGVVTLDQQRAIVHPNTSDPNDSVTLAAASLITVIGTVTDHDGDHASVSANIGTSLHFLDDGPAIGTVQNQQVDDLASATATGTLHFTPGADGAGLVTNITYSASASAPITSGGHNIVTHFTGGVLTGFQDANNNGVYDAGTDTVQVFTLAVNPSAGSSGQYVFTLLTPLDGSVVSTPIGGSSAFGAGPAGEQVLSGGSPSAALSIVEGFNTTGFDPSTWTYTTESQGSVNGSTVGWGVANNEFNGNELIRFDFDTSNASTPPPGGFDGPLISFAHFSFPQFGAGDVVYYKVFYEHADGTSAGSAIVQLTTAQLTGGVTITAPAGLYLDYVDFFDSDGQGKITLDSVGVNSTSHDETLTFTTTLTDGDGDPVTSGSFTVHVADGLVPFAPAAPIVLDLNHNGLEFLAASAGVTYDYSGTGHPVSTAWVAPSDGLLAYNDGGHMVISFTSYVAGATTDLQGLAAFDTNHDGKLDAGDAQFASFGVWQDANSNGVVDAGEYHTLTQAGIASINLTSDGVSYTAAGGDVTVAGEGTFTYADGSTGKLGDVSFATGAATSSTSPLTKAANDAERAAAANGAGYAGALAAAGLIAASAAGVVSSDTLHVDGFKPTSNHSNGPSVDTAPTHVTVTQDLSSTFGTTHILAPTTPSSHLAHGSDLHSHSLGHQPSSLDGPTASPLSSLLGADNAGVPNLFAGAQGINLPSGGGVYQEAVIGGSPSGATPGTQAVVAQILSDALQGGHAAGHTLANLVEHFSSGGPAGAKLGATLASLGPDAGHSFNFHGHGGLGFGHDLATLAHDSLAAAGHG